MDASSVPTKLGTDEAFNPSPIPSLKSTNSTFPYRSCDPKDSHLTALSRNSNVSTRDIDVIVTCPQHDDQTKIHESNKQRCEINQKTSFDANIANSNSTFTAPQDLENFNQQEREQNKNSAFKVTSVDDNRNSDNYAVHNNNNHSFRSISSPQLSTKPISRSKVYRKTSLKSFKTNCPPEPWTGGRRAPITRIINVSSKNPSKKTTFPEKNENDLGVPRGKWNVEDVHITCNPLSTPYPYSTPCQKVENTTTEQPQPEDEPKGRSCGSFLPILALIPQTVISFQYLSPKMKFSWWRNKIS